MNWPRYPPALVPGQRIAVTAPGSGVEATLHPRLDRGWTWRWPASQLSHAQALTSTLAALPCPVLVDLDISHVPPQMLLINGALAELRVTHRSGAIQDAELRQQLI